MSELCFLSSAVKTGHISQRPLVAGHALNTPAGFNGLFFRAAVYALELLSLVVLVARLGDAEAWPTEHWFGMRPGHGARVRITEAEPAPTSAMFSGDLMGL